MSNAPVDTAKIINWLRKRKHLKNIVIENTELIDLAGGSHKQWSEYLSGPKAQSIIMKVNKSLFEDNLELVSVGHKTEKWKLVTVARAHMEKAAMNLSKIDRDFRLAHDHVLAVCEDLRAPLKLREFAKSWLELFEDPNAKRGRSIMMNWAGELLDMREEVH